MLLTWVRRYVSRRKHAAPAAFRSRDSLYALIERESLRHDRNGGSLTLLTLTLVNRHSLQADLEVAATILRVRLRATDEIGLLEDNCVGVLLPETTEDGARVVADELSAQLAARGVKVRVGRLTYPSDKDDSQGDDGRWDSPSSTQPLATLLARPLPAWKRLVDVVGASLGMVLVSPILLAAAAAVKLTSRGPVLYVNQRAGLSGRAFNMFKLRTMVVDADRRKADLMELNEQDGPAFKIRHDPRVTAVGRWLRKTSIDELPQLWNVLRGDMSLVGPRPLPCHESQACHRWQKRRLDVTPGLTCIWQVHGRSQVSFAEWVRMDIRYMRSRSFFGDLHLLAMTVPAVVTGQGAQ